MGPPRFGKDYKWHFSCQLWDYMPPPTTFYGKQTQPLMTVEVCAIQINGIHGSVNIPVRFMDPTCLYIHVYMYIYIYIFIHVNISTCIYKCTDIYMYTHVICIHVNIFIYTCICIYVYTYGCKLSNFYST